MLLSVDFVLNKDADHVDSVVIFHLLLLSFDDEALDKISQCLAIKVEALVLFCELLRHK